MGTTTTVTPEQVTLDPDELFLLEAILEQDGPRRKSIKWCAYTRRTPYFQVLSSLQRHALIRYHHDRERFLLTGWGYRIVLAHRRAAAERARTAPVTVTIPADVAADVAAILKKAQHVPFDHPRLVQVWAVANSITKDLENRNG